MAPDFELTPEAQARMAERSKRYMAHRKVAVAKYREACAKSPDGFVEITAAPGWVDQAPSLPGPDASDLPPLVEDSEIKKHK